MVDVAQLVEPRIVIPAVVGSSPIVHPISSMITRIRGLLAQLVEQLTLNQLVIGSSPIRPTNFNLHALGGDSVPSMKPAIVVLVGLIGLCGQAATQAASTAPVAAENGMVVSAQHLATRVGVES